VSTPVSLFQSIDLERIPLRVEGRLARLLGVGEGNLSVVHGEAGALPDLRGVLARPLPDDVSLVLRVHARNGIPLAQATVDVARGEHAFSTQGLTLFAMEGYSHLSAADRRMVEGRVWSRRAYATASVA
jgi:hypothetical protein